MSIEGEDEDEGNFAAAFEEFASKPADASAAASDPDPDAGAPAPADPPAGEPAPQEAASIDPWANASPELIAERDKIIEERDRFRHSDQSQRGRIGALQRKVTELSSSQPLTPQAKEEDEGKAQALRDKLAQIKEDYPDLGGPILEIVDSLQAEIRALAPTVATIAEDRSAAVVQAELGHLAERHPDWRAVATSKDWEGWVADQPASIQAQAESDDAREVSAALTLFKTERGIAMGKDPDPKPEPKPDARRSKQLEGSRAVTSRPAPAASGAPDDFDGAFASFAAKRERQQRRA